MSLDFIPWHRAWSHSVVVGCAMGGVAALLWDVWAGLIVAGALVLHALLDQLGVMGGALFYPFSRRRLGGMRLMHSGAPLPNLVAVWSCCLLIFWNLWRAAPGGVSLAGTRALLIWGLALPIVMVAVYRRLCKRRAAIRLK